MKNCTYALLLLVAFSLPAFAQHDIELSGGYRHISGDNGLDGYSGGISWNPIPNFQLFVTYDGVYDNSTIGGFELTPVGVTIVNSHMQEILTGPRFFLPGVWKGHGRIEGHRLIPYLQAGFGEARLHTDLKQSTIGAVQAADTAFAWEIGGGADFRIYPHFTLRPDLGFLRTHFADSGQGRVRLGLSVVWSLRSRSQ
ncbi:MAG TPA: outer membrane beta-barrel protein [Candidatus Angelobacter sp.]